jgi:hypothetical protein
MSTDLLGDIIPFFYTVIPITSSSPSGIQTVAYVRLGSRLSETYEDASCVFMPSLRERH